MTDNATNRWSRIPFIGQPLANRLSGRPNVAVLRLHGVIGKAPGAGPRGGLTLHALERPIAKAFATPRLKAVALSVNSPGGSPVQSALIAGRIRALAEEKKIPVLAFCEDAAASGGYWLACAADEIYAQEASIIGSIGVIAAGFGFVGLLERIGVERRVYTAGENKLRLDPFQPEAPADVRHVKKLQGDIHEQFKDYVRRRRGDKLRGSEKTLFSGDFWTGKTALESGLVDGLAEMRSLCREKFGEKICFREIPQPKSWMRLHLGGVAAGALSGAAADIAAGVEERLWWSRLGL